MLNYVTVMPICNLIEYSDSYSKTSIGFWKYYENIPLQIIMVRLLNLIGVMLLIHLINPKFKSFSWTKFSGSK